MSTFAVTGASGHLGRFAVQELLAHGVTASGIVAIVRNRHKAPDLLALGVQVREADYSRPETLGEALEGVDRLLLVSSKPGHQVADHSNVVAAARTAGISRIIYTSMLNSDATTSPLAGEHRQTERVIREAGVPFTFLRNGYYTEVYTDPLAQYLQHGEIVGASGNGRLSAAPRQDYAAAGALALLEDETGNRTYELGGPAFDIAELARVISEVTGTHVTYRDLPVDEYASWLQQSGVDEKSAQFVAALDASIARGDLETNSQDLAELLGRPVTPLVDTVRAAHGGASVAVRARVNTIGLIGAGNIGGTLARLAVDAGYHVVVSNSRGPATLDDLVDELGPRARAATPTDAATAGDIVVVTVPLKAYRQIPVEPLAGKVVIDTNNYYPDRDGHIAELDDETTTSSQLLQAHLPTSHVVKAFNTIFFKHLATMGRLHGASDRSALAIAGDDETAKKTTAAFLDAIGYDTYDVGPLREGWRLGNGSTTPYAYGADGSFEHPQPADAERLASLLAQAD